MGKCNKYWVSNSEYIPIDTTTILNEYLLSLKLENKAYATITKYRKILEGFLRDCTIPIEEFTSEDIREWLYEATDPLFTNRVGNRLLGNGVRKVLKKAGIKAGLKQSFHPHC